MCVCVWCNTSDLGRLPQLQQGVHVLDLVSVQYNHAEAFLKCELDIWQLGAFI